MFFFLPRPQLGSIICLHLALLPESSPLTPNELHVLFQLFQLFMFNEEREDKCSLWGICASSGCHVERRWAECLDGGAGQMERVTAEGVGRIPGGLWRLTVINVDQLALLGVSFYKTARPSGPVRRLWCSAALLGTTVTHAGTGFIRHCTTVSLQAG